ncbi:MAG TPA: sugar transferase, partial [Syntrophorhabdaceae bacterium]|nr:sugar transferase [Syntrophorhabdaceae bacterium]
PQKMIFKRCLDVLFSCCLLLLFLPLFVLISIIIKIDSQGPIFFRHKRVGKDFKEFIMLKFRTMYVNHEPALKEYLKKHPEAIEDLEKRNKIKDDPRITRFGKFLRRSSLDELPQLLNVLKGDMSIIGPRPDSMDAVKNFLDEYKDVYSMVRPGMTGLWQVSGRSELTYDIRVKLDQLYILNWSLWLDFVIIIKTFKALFTGRGAY